jgi:hypothetical protein
MNIAKKAKLGLKTSGDGPKRRMHNKASASSAAFTAAMVSWNAAGPTRSLSVISSVAPVATSQITQNAVVC